MPGSTRDNPRTERRADQSRAAGAFPQLEPVLLMIADISGYTRYMTANAKTLAHSQVIITELMMVIIREVELPVEVAKLEGDAVFLYCRRQTNPEVWAATKRSIGEKLLKFFHLFGEKVTELSQSTMCSCSACAHIDGLRLKIVVHSGEALFHQVLQLQELAGVDVILVHRLLKNSVKASQYILLTAAAWKDVHFPEEVSWVKSRESYEELGRVETMVYLPDGETSASRPSAPAIPSLIQRVRKSCALFWKIWCSGVRGRGATNLFYRNLTIRSGPAQRRVFAIFTLLATPLFLPVGMLLAALRALKPRRVGVEQIPSVRSW